MDEITTLFDDLKIKKNGCNRKMKKEILEESRSWYKINEIPLCEFIKCCMPIYNILEDKYQPKSHIDPFLKSVLMGSAANDEWNIIEKARLRRKNLEMKLGYFHEELMGKFDGYYTLPNGHHTGCDVMKKDESVIFEVKNRDNTVKGSDGKHIISMLKKHKADGKKAVFVQINCPDGKVNRYGDTAFDIYIWNGKEVYEFLSGRETFFEDLLSTVDYVFSNYKTFDKLNALL